MDSSRSLMHTVGSRVWLRDLDEGWVKGEVLNIGDDNKLNVRLEDGREKAFSESEIPLQNPGVRGVEVCDKLSPVKEPFSAID
jgi:myosin-5